MNAVKKQQMLLAVNVDRDVVATLETHDSELPGIDVVSIPVRYFPFGELGAHLIGYMREVDSADLSDLESRVIELETELEPLGSNGVGNPIFAEGAAGVRSFKQCAI